MPVTTPGMRTGAEGSHAPIDYGDDSRRPTGIGGPVACRAGLGAVDAGDKAGHDTLINFVASDRFDLHQVETPDGKPAPSGNATAGLPPDTRVVFFAPRAAPWAPPNWQMRHYRLRYVADSPVQPLRFRLLFTVSDSRFNRSGRRWLPSLVPPSESQGAPVGTPWPPKRSSRRTIR